MLWSSTAWYVRIVDANPSHHTASGNSGGRNVNVSAAQDTTDEFA